MFVLYSTEEIFKKSFDLTVEDIKFTEEMLPLDNISTKDLIFYLRPVKIIEKIIYVMNKHLD